MANTRVSWSEMLRRLKTKHGTRFSYHKTKDSYTGAVAKILVTCRVHGDFQVTPSNHLASKHGGCSSCVAVDASSKNAKEIARLHSTLTFPNLKGVTATDKVTFVCDAHGEQFRQARYLLQGLGCKHCDNTRTVPKSVREATKIACSFGNKVLVGYVNARTPMQLTCPVHGVRNSLPHNLKPCPDCVSHAKFVAAQKKRISAAKKVHDGRYKYVLNSDGSVTITCPDHGNFEQRMHSHISGQGCPKCNCMSNPEFFERWNKAVYAWKDYVFPDGGVRIVQGYEPRALDLLVAEGVKSKAVVTGRDVPSFVYTFNGKTHRYYPDVYLPKSKTLIEVKSTWTWSRDRDRNIAKLNSARAAGYTVRLLVFDTTRLVKDITNPPLKRHHHLKRQHK